VGARDLPISKLLNTGPGTPAQPLFQWALGLLGIKELGLGFDYPPPSIVKVKTNRPSAVGCYGATFALPVPCTVDIQCFLTRVILLFFCEIFLYSIKVQIPVTGLSAYFLTYFFINTCYNLFLVYQKH